MAKECILTNDFVGVILTNKVLWSKIEMLDTLNEPLSQETIKSFHFELKSGVFEDRANGYAIGNYKKRPNMIGMYQTISPENVPREMYLLLEWYHEQEINVPVLAEFHAKYESIHPFQDGNVTQRHLQKAA